MPLEYFLDLLERKLPLRNMQLIIDKSGQSISFSFVHKGLFDAYLRRNNFDELESTHAQHSIHPQFKELARNIKGVSYFENPGTAGNYYAYNMRIGSGFFQAGIGRKIKEKENLAETIKKIRSVLKKDRFFLRKDLKRESKLRKYNIVQGE